MDSDYDENDVYQVDKISLEETRKKVERRKRTFEYGNIYMVLKIEMI